MPPQCVVFATPTLTNAVCTEFHRSMLETEWLLAANGIATAHKLVGGDPYLARVRNRLATDALVDVDNMTDFFFIDDDMGWEAEAVLRLLLHPAPVVAGVYPKKNDVTEFPCELDFTDEHLWIDDRGFYRARMVPTGFLRIKRHVLQRFAETSAVYRDMDGNKGTRDTFNIFQMGHCAEDGKWWGEDYAWCQMWGKMGGEIWVDPNIRFSHRGQKRWEANFIDSVRKFEAGLVPIVDVVPPAPAPTQEAAE